MKDDTNESNSENEEQKRKKLERLEDNSDVAQKGIMALDEAKKQFDLAIAKAKYLSSRVFSEDMGHGHTAYATKYEITPEGRLYFLKEATRLSVPPAQYDRIIEKYEQMVRDFTEST